MSRTAIHPNRKTKKSYTLSPESVAFLETMRKKRQMESISAVLEEILQAVRRSQELASVERAVSAYYSSLDDKELQEHTLWGDFAMAESSDEES
jgi:hypothetical protein